MVHEPGCLQADEHDTGLTPSPYTSPNTSLASFATKSESSNNPSWRASVSLKSEQADLVPTRTPGPLNFSRSVPNDVHLAKGPESDGDNDQSGVISLEPEQVTNLRHWILGFALVDFDLDTGPVTRSVHPPLWLSLPEKENIAFSSFPDSLRSNEGSQIHSFRLRDHGSCRESSALSARRPDPLDGFLYGYAHFCQRKDTSSKRGYSQCSVVLLTHLQYPALFTEVIRRFGLLYDKHGSGILETALHNIAQWCKPLPGTICELGFVGDVFHAELPQTTDEPQLSEATMQLGTYDSTSTHIVASMAPHRPPPILLFQASLTHLWSIWECLIFCEPILIFGKSSTETSQAVWWLRDLLRPIPSAIDFRPYFTMQDKDHSMFINKLPPRTGLVLGVTNPFFEKSCRHWPHVLSLGRNSSIKVEGKAPVPAPGWVTKIHKRYTSKDRPFLKELEDACSSNDQERIALSSVKLRRHFSSRTIAMLAPLNRYFSTLIPSPAERRNGSERIKPFNTVNFFASLKKYGSAIPFRSARKEKEFYERWLKTPAFGMWLAQQEKTVVGVLKGS